MEEWIKVSAKTVDDAVLEASIQLGTSRDNIDYRVIERETKGFLGLGAKPAVIEAKKKVVEDEKSIIDEVFGQGSNAPAKGDRKKAPKKENHKESAPKSKSEKSEKAVKKEEKAAVKAEKKAEKEAVKAEKKAEKSPVQKEENAPKKTENVSADKSSRQERKPEQAERTVKAPADPAEVTRRAESFLTEVFEAMKVDAALKTTYEDGTLSIEISGEDMGILIGKRGQTLDSLQYLTSLVVNKGKAAYVRVKIDTEDYRERRKATLENLAKNIALKVKKTRRPVYLEPMNPYERRIIHYALQDDPFVATHSEGEEPCRKVVVTLRKRDNRERFAQDAAESEFTEE